MIEIRPVEEGDLEPFYEFQADPIATDMAVFGAREREAHFAHWRTKILGNPAAYARTVIVDGAVAGNVLSWSHEGMRYIGYWIRRDYWGAGVGTQAVTLLLEEITERPIFALVVTSNRGSQRVLEKNGFVRIEQRPSPEDGIEEYLYRLD